VTIGLAGIKFSGSPMSQGKRKQIALIKEKNTTNPNKSLREK
jgi:hypothetical protein